MAVELLTAVEMLEAAGLENAALCGAILRSHIDALPSVARRAALERKAEQAEHSAEGHRRHAEVYMREAANQSMVAKAAREEAETIDPADEIEAVRARVSAPREPGHGLLFIPRATVATCQIVKVLPDGNVEVKATERVHGEHPRHKFYASRALGDLLRRGSGHSIVAAWIPGWREFVAGVKS